mmetsp:Transcript_18498/g.28401  ORF Transcript_18498/g.28401 Transcript_18498/m.28401 type:complete len:129 (-) Transcript_18498:1170-1556(-)
MCGKLNMHGELVKERKLSTPWRNNFFAVFFAEQAKVADSKHSSYLKSLPQTVAQFPIRYSDEETKMLNGSLLVRKLDNIKQAWREDYDHLVQAEPELADVCTFDEFVKGKVIASSRAYDIVYTDGSVR